VINGPPKTSLAIPAKRKKIGRSKVDISKKEVEILCRQTWNDYL